jgi:uncharacterized membrane protein (DUF2068 family)
LSAFFAAVTIFVAVLFVRALGEREIRTGLFTYAALCAATAIGLWRVRRWGRSLALLMALGNAGLGTMSLLAVLIARRGPLLGPGTLLVASVGVAYLLSRSAFALPVDMGASSDD